MHAWRVVMLAVAVAVAGANHVVEEATSVRFPLDVPGESSSLLLLGATVRVKKILFVNVQVYAVGIYAEPGAVEELKGKEPNEIYDYLMEHPTQSSLRLTMVRSVTGDQMGGALKEAVQPRLKRFTSDEGAIARDMSAFEKQFDMSSLAAGTILTFTRLKSGSLVSEIDGKDKGEIASEALSKSLFSVFLDEDSVVDRSKLLQRLAVL